MTRYSFKQQSRKYVIGYDAALITYFCQVSENGKLIHSNGCKYEEHQDYKHLIDELVSKGFQLPEIDLNRLLTQDKLNAKPLSPLQNEIKEMFQNNK